MQSQHKTPLRRKISIIQQQSSSKLDTSRSTVREDSLISDLYSKYLSVSKQIVTDYDATHFNMAEIETGNRKHRFDQQMVEAKLKQLENIAQLKQANQELDQRRKKITKHTNPALLGKNQQSYLKTYKKYVQNASRRLFDAKQDTDSDEDIKKKDDDTVEGVIYYSELKKHPRFLQYTIDKLKQKQLQQLEQERAKNQTLQSIKLQMKTICEGNKQSLTARQKLIEKESNPEQIADNIFRKIYTKQYKQVSNQEARTERRIGKVIDRQDLMLQTLEGRSLSKDNYKKLKGRLAHIINELYHDDKRHQKKVRLPKITLSKTSRITIEDND